MLGSSISAPLVCRLARESGDIRRMSDAKRLGNARNQRPLQVVSGSKIYGSTGESKACVSCGTLHPATTEFFYRRKRENGRAYLSSSCRTCVAAAEAVRREQNPEAARESNRRNVAKNGRRHQKQKTLRKLFDPSVAAAEKERNRAWAKKNRDHVVAYQVAYRLENKILIDERDRAYRERTKEQQAVWRRNYKSRRKGADGFFAVGDVLAIFGRQSGLCFWCGCDIRSEYHVDHFIPLVKGGSNLPANIVLACPTCNTSRGSKMPDEFRMYLESIRGLEPEIEKRRAYMRQKMREHRGRLKGS